MQLCVSWIEVVEILPTNRELVKLVKVLPSHSLVNSVTSGSSQSIQCVQMFWISILAWIWYANKVKYFLKILVAVFSW